MKMKLLLSRRRLSELERPVTRPGALACARMAVRGLFAALIAVGAFMKMDPVGADTMNFTLRRLFVLLAGLLLALAGHSGV